MGAVFGEGEREDREMAAQSQGEEDKAIRDYGERGSRTSDPDLRKVFKHARGEEEEHSRLFRQWMGEAREDIPDPEDNAHLPDPDEEGEEFQKTAPIHAVQMDEPFEVETIEGPMQGKVEDWLAKGHNGDLWVVDDDMFRSTYEPTSHLQDTSSEDNELKVSEMFDEANTHRSGQPLPPIDPQSYQTWQSPAGYHLLTPEGNEQWWDSTAKRAAYLDWHRELSGHQSKGVKQVQPTAPKMAEVFRVQEAPIQNRPPPGSQPVNPTEWNKLGAMGQSLKKGMEAMTSAGEAMTPYKTPAGDRVAFPKDAAPGRGPMKADTTKGVWTPMTGSQNAGTGTPSTPFSPTTTMK